MTEDLLLDPKAAGELIGVSPITLQKWRCKGGGPRFVRVSYRTIRYRHKDLMEWIDGKVRRTTSPETRRLAVL